MLTVVSGPSGVGKSFCVEYLTSRHGFRTYVPYTSRPPRTSESEGRHYFFRSENDLKQLSANFTRGYWDKPLKNQYWYGWPTDLDAAAESGESFVIHAATRLALQLKTNHPRTFLVFLDYSSIECFERRLAERFPRAEHDARRAHQKTELSRKNRFDRILNSDNPQDLAEQLLPAILDRFPPPLATTLPAYGALSDADIITSIQSQHGIKLTGISVDEAIKHVHGWSLDLTLGPDFYRVPQRLFRRAIFGEIFDLAASNREDMSKRFRQESVSENKGFVLTPHEFVLAFTREQVFLPENVSGLLSGRSSYASIGLSIEFSQIILQPGHNNVIRLQIQHNLPYPVVLYPGILIVQSVFFRLSSPADQSYLRQQSAKYSGVLRSRFYEDNFYAQVRAVRNPVTRINWQLLLDALLMVGLPILMGSYVLKTFAPAPYDRYAKVCEFAGFIISLPTLIVRTIRFVLAILGR